MLSMVSQKMQQQTKVSDFRLDYVASLSIIIFQTYGEIFGQLCRTWPAFTVLPPVTLVFDIM